MILAARLAGHELEVQVEERADGSYRLVWGQEALLVDAQEITPGSLSLRIDGRSHWASVEPQPAGFRVRVGAHEFAVELSESVPGAAAPRRGAEGPARLLAPMPGKVVRVLAAVGDAVEAGQGLAVMEAMKMENELRAPRAGRLAQLLVGEGQTVESAQLIAVVE